MYTVFHAEFSRDNEKVRHFGMKGPNQHVFFLFIMIFADGARGAPAEHFHGERLPDAAVPSSLGAAPAARGGQQLLPPMTHRTTGQVPFKKSLIRAEGLDFRPHFWKIGGPVLAYSG